MKRPVMVAALLASALASVPAAAFVMNAKNIVRRFSETQAFDHGHLSPLVGSARLLDQPQALPARVELLKTGCKSSVLTAKGKSQASLSGSHVTTDGVPLPALEAFVALGCPLLSARDTSEEDVEAAVSRFLSGLGVNLAVSSLSQVNGRAGFVVGARPREATRAQVWIDKETGRLMRVIGSHGGQLWDVRFVDGASIATNHLFPRTATVWKNGERQLELSVMAQTPVVPADSTGSDFVEEDAD